MKIRILFLALLTYASLSAMEEKYQEPYKLSYAKLDLEGETKEWLSYAREDLDAATILINNNPSLLRQTLVQTHQSAEKGLKAYLMCKKKGFERTHNLNKLLDYCKELNHKFEKYNSFINSLNKYTNKMRYPGNGTCNLNYQEVSQLVKRTKGMYGYVLKKIGVSLLDAIFWANKNEFIDILIQNGADVNATFDASYPPAIEGNTCLTLATTQGKIELVKKLIEHGSQVNAQDKNGETALFSAVEIAALNFWIQNNVEYKKYKEIIKILLENGAQLNIQNLQGKTALSPAVRYKARKLVMLLLKSGINVAHKNVLVAIISMANDPSFANKFKDVLEILEAKQ